MRVPVRVRLAEDPFGYSMDTPAAPDLSIPAYQLTLNTPLGAGGAGNVVLPTNAPSATADWFKSLPALATSGAVVAGTIARLTQSSPRPVHAPPAGLAVPFFNASVPLTQQPIVWIGAAALGVVALLALTR